MDYSEWKGKTDGFKKVDVRGAAGNFLDGIKKQAAWTKMCSSKN